MFKRRINPRGKDTVFAFTLIEMMIVVGLLIIFLGFGLTSGDGIRRQLAFSRDQQVVISEIYKARALAISTYEKNTDGGVLCGYGVRVVQNGGSPGELVTFKVSSDSSDADCLSEYEIMTREDVRSRMLEESVITPANADSVLFISPIPDVRFYPGIENNMCLTLRAEGVTGAVYINKFGQVRTEVDCIGYE